MSTFPTSLFLFDFISFWVAGDVEFNTTETCGGVLSIKYQKTPEKRLEVCPSNFPRGLSNKLCNKLNCRDFDPSKRAIKQVNHQACNYLDRHLSLAHFIVLILVRLGKICMFKSIMAKIKLKFYILQVKNGTKSRLQQLLQRPALLRLKGEVWNSYFLFLWR